MKTHDFYYDLPEELIAQTPIEKRDNSRLLALDKETGAWEHRHFFDLPEYLRPGDCLMTGTPAGVILGKPAAEQVWLKDGDTVTVEIEGIGRLENKLAAR